MRVSYRFAMLAAITALALPATADAACKDVTYIGARGSGQPAGKGQGMGPEVYAMATSLETKFRAAGESMAMAAVDYTAESTDRLKPSKAEIAAMTFGGGALRAGAAAYYYHHRAKPFLKSIDDGTERIKELARNTVAACPDADLVLAGYSQGAMAVHAAERDLKKDDEEVFDAITGTLLLADGDRKKNSAAKAIGSAKGGQGIRAALAAGDRDVADPELTVNICDEHDLVCDFSLKRVVSGKFNHDKELHESYLKKRKAATLDAAVDWLAGELGLED